MKYKYYATDLPKINLKKVYQLRNNAKMFRKASAPRQSHIKNYLIMLESKIKRQLKKQFKVITRIQF